MIKIERVIIPGSAQWDTVVMGMRNPMNSWDRSDSRWRADVDYGDPNVRVASWDDEEYRAYCIGNNDYKLMKQLCNAGPEHRKFMRMLPVYFDITAPMYWWKEFDTYKIGTVRNSCSTMHKITAKEFDVSDFSTDQMLNKPYLFGLGEYTPINNMNELIDGLNELRRLYLETDDADLEKKYWYSIIQLLPSSYNQKSTVFTNYETLRNIYFQRRFHKLNEWHEFCKVLKQLPLSELITGEFEE